MKVFDSGMPEETYWNSLFDVPMIVDWLDLESLAGPIAEIGCGYGTFTVEIARRTSRRIHAIDIEPGMIERAGSSALAAGVRNVELSCRDVLEAGTGLPPRSMGLVVLFNILHSPERKLLLGEASRIMNDAGRIAIIHWRKDIPTPRGPSVESRPDLAMIGASIAGLDLRIQGEDRILEPYHWGVQLSRSPWPVRFPCGASRYIMRGMSSPPAAARGMPGPERLTHDPLTGLRNEHLFRLQLPTEFSRARDGEANGALIAIKLDNIVAINAQHGRSGGDEALRAVAYVLENYRSAGGAGRETHVVFKLGGPVFGYFIPTCSAPEARRAAEQIRDLVSTSDLYIGRLAVSIAVVNLYEFFLHEGKREEIAVHIEQVAFQRLGIAERAGGNTICDSSDVAEAAASARPVVLIVDPEPSSMEVLIRSLEAAEFTVKTCTDGESAVAFIQATPPGLIICEAMTPRLNGFTVRDRMRANALWNAIPFILVSHKRTEEFIRMAAEGKILHYLKKPLSVTEVVGLAENLTRNKAG